MLIAQQFSTVANQNLAKPAIRYLGKEITYAMLRSDIGRLSYLYQHEFGEQKNVRVAFYTHNSPAVITTFFALTNIRATIIPLNPDLAPSDVIEWIKASEATHLAVTSDLIGRARELLQSAHMNLPIIEIEKKHGGEYDTSFTAPPEHQPLETDPILLLRSGGATGKPKYVVFTHKQIAISASSVKGAYHLLPTDRMLTTMSWSHPFALLHGMLLPLLSGACCVIHHGLEAVEFLDFLAESRVTRLIGTPPFFLRLLVTCKNEKRLLPGLKSVTVGLGMLSPELRRAFELLKVQVTQSYGQVENFWTICMQEVPNEDQPGCVGKGLPGFKYKVLDESGDTIEGDQTRTGPFAVTSPTIMTGYYKLEKETKNAIRGTWLYTGDVARLEGEGDTLRIYYLGRKSDLIKIEGNYTSVAPLDPVIRTIPGVMDGAAFVAKNIKGHDVVALAVVKVQGSPLTEKQINEHCQAKASSLGLEIKAVVFTDAIPRDLGNNVNYTRLRGQFSGNVG